MSKSYRRNSGKAALASLTGLVLASSMWAPASAVEAPDGAPTAEGIELQTLPPDLKISGNLTKATGEVAVYVQFEGEGAFERTQPQVVQQGRQAPVDRSAEVREIRAQTQAKADAVVAEVSGTALYTTSNTIPGVAVRADAEAIRALAGRPDVVKISRLAPKVPTNKGGVIDTRALNTWAGNVGETGNGVTIAIIDTGVDYTHAGFGGPGTIEAFEAASAPEAQAAAPDPAWYDEAKYVGGWDLVGDSYNADPGADPDGPFPYQPEPMPDPNPIDCQSHGSHVAGTAAGYGVNADGTPFDGSYAELDVDAVNEMRIGPGTAPEAQVVSLRVFGCAGSSLVVGEALDRVLDPNDDGNFGDRAHVVNMSLGSNFPIPDDPEVDIVNALTDQGVLSVASSGNDGDVYDIGGTPGSAKSALTVANSIGSQITLDRVDILAPEGEAGTASGQYSVNFDFSQASEDELTGTVVVAPESNRFGCNAFPANSFDGEWVWLQWEEDGTFPCGSGVRFNNVEAAGGAGVVLDSPRDVFDAGIGGNATIPGVQFNRESSDRLRPAAEAGTLEIQLDPEYIAASSGPSNALDTLNPSSSRGVHGSFGVVKPDVAAPGTQIGSVAVGTGNGGSVKTGTSMSAPNVAGIAALVYAATDLNAHEVKNAIMNTATNDITVEPGGDLEYGPNRTGAGRVDALNAVTTQALAYDSEDPSLVTVNFGVVEVGADGLSATRQIAVRNISDAPHTYTATYLPATTMPGVDIQLSADTVEVPANSTVTVDITMSIVDPGALVKTIDPTAQVTQAITLFNPPLEVARQFIADASGRVEFTSETANTLRVPVYAAPKPTSDMSGGARVQYPTGSQLESILTLSGRGLSQGGALGEPTSYTSLVSPFVLGQESVRRTDLPLASLSSLDLKAVGAASTAPGLVAAGEAAEDGVLNIGVSTWANWGALAGGINIDLDVDNDETADFVLETFRAPDVDLGMFLLSAVGEDGALTNLTVLPINGVEGSTDTNTFDTNVVTVPVPLSVLGLDLGNSNPIKYNVHTTSDYNVTIEDGEEITAPVDETGWIDFNLTDPSLWFIGASGAGTAFADLDGSTIQVNRDRGVAKANILLLHHHNASGTRDEIVPIQVGKKTFTDIGRADHRESIVALEQLAITDGWEEANGTFTFRPFEAVNRDVMAAFMYRLADVSTFATPANSPFADLNGPADPGADTEFFYKEMTWMEATNLSNGWEEPEGLPTYRPLAVVNRDVMAAFMYRYASKYCDIQAAIDYDGTDNPFADIQDGFVFENEVSWMSNAGISFGWTENGRTEFRPYEEVTREQMAAFMIRLLDYVDDNGGCTPGRVDN